MTQLLVQVDDADISGKNTENTEALVIASKEIGLEVNTEKTKYMVMSRDQNAGKMGT